MKLISSPMDRLDLYLAGASLGWLIAGTTGMAAGIASSAVANVITRVIILSSQLKRDRVSIEEFEKQVDDLYSKLKRNGHVL
jgi:hypothetical protein